MYRPSNALPASTARLIRTLLVVLAAIVALPGCEVIGDIFQAGFWTGIVLVAILVAVIFVAVRLFK